MIRLSWVAQHGMAYSFIELHKPLCCDKAMTHEGVYIFRGAIWKKARGLVLNETFSGQICFIFYCIFFFLSQLCLG